MNQKNENRTDKFIKNIIGSAVLQVVTIITGFISPKLMLSAFGSEINGITSSITQFISYLTLVEAGLSNATIFALYKPLADKDDEARDAVVSATKIAYYKIGMLFVAMSIGLAFVYPFIGHTEVLSKFELGLLVLVLCSNSAMNFFVLAKYRTLLSADQCGYIISGSNAIQLIAHITLVYIGIRLKLNVIAVRAMGLSSLFLTSLILSTVVKKKYGNINYNTTPNMKALDKRWDAMFLQIMGVVVGASPVVIMTAVLDYKLISVYTIYNMIAGSVSSCITVFTSGLSASFGNIYAIGDKYLLKKTTGEFRTAFYMLITIVYSIMMTTLLPFVRIYTDGISDVNYIIPSLGLLITLRGLLENFGAPHGMLVYSFGKFKEIRRQTITQAAITVVLVLVLTLRMGLNGVIIGLCVSHLYMLVEYLILCPKELVEMSIVKNVRQILQVLLVVFGVFFCFNAIAYQPSGYLEWLVYACVVGCASVIITFFVFYMLDRKEVHSIFQRILGLTRRKK